MAHLDYCPLAHDGSDGTCICADIRRIMSAPDLIILRTKDDRMFKITDKQMNNFLGEVGLPKTPLPS